MENKNIKSSEELTEFLEYFHQEKSNIEHKLKRIDFQLKEYQQAVNNVFEGQKSTIKVLVNMQSQITNKTTALKHYLLILYVLFAILAVACGFSSTAHALPVPTPPPPPAPLTFPMHGLDVYGIHHKLFPCDDLIELTPNYTPLGFISDATFGDSDACLRKYLRLKHPFFIRAHLLNSTAVRNGKTQPQEPLYNYTLDQIAREIRDPNSAIYQKIGRELMKVNSAVSAENPATIQYISPLLEHDLSPQDTATMFKILLRIYPGQVWVDNPVNNFNPTPANTFKEKHNKELQPNPTADFVSHDGVNFWDANVPDGKARVTKGMLMWEQPFNLRAKIEDQAGEAVFIAPRARTWIPTRAEIALAVEMLKPKSAPEASIPAQCGSRSPRQFTRNEVWKISSDNHGKNDTKDAKPLLITYQRSGAVDILNKNGQTIGRMPYYGSFAKGGFRYYYRDKQAYDLGQLAISTSGSSNIFLRVNGACYPVNAYYREGIFR